MVQKISPESGILFCGVSGKVGCCGASYTLVTGQLVCNWFQLYLLCGLYVTRQILGRQMGLKEGSIVRRPPICELRGGECTGCTPLRGAL